VTNPARNEWASIPAGHLEDLGERELQQVLVEPHRPLDVGGQQRDVVDAAGAAGGAFGPGPQEGLPDALALGFDGLQVDGHGSS
jgi:hypothetical protein